ncbi:MAG: hypothetical protein EXR62_15820 [Chloroflexi bacterium]|nr:hypothetical protein [Chloroflexota bacterium]
MAATIPAETLGTIVTNTVAVLTGMPERREEWRETIAGALQDARQRGPDWQIEVEFFTAVLALLGGQAADLPASHPYAAALAQIRAAVAAGGTPPDEVEPEPVIAAIQAFVSAPDWAASRQVVEARQDLLFRPQVVAIFEENIDRAKAAGDQQWADTLALHLEILRACRAEGIGPAFERLAQMEAEGDDDVPTS